MRYLRIENTQEDCILDDVDYLVYSQFKWRVQRRDNTIKAVIRGTCPKGGKYTTIYLHREIMGVTDPKVSVDHIDGNPLNNQRANLRLCNNAENHWNTKKPANNTSGFKGVSWIKTGKRRKRWMAKIRKGKTFLTIGYYLTPEEAGIAYNNKAKELFGDFARLNEI